MSKEQQPTKKGTAATTGGLFKSAEERKGKKENAEGVKKEKKTNPNSNKGVATAVEQIDLQNDVILARFPSERAAAAALGLDRAGICKCVKGEQTSSGGFGWRKAVVATGEKETSRCGGRAPMAVERLDIETGAVQERYPSLSAAATAVGMHYKNGIWKCTKGERKSCNGYAWRKAEDAVMGEGEQNENNNAAAGNAIMVRPIIAASAANATKLSQSKGPAKSDRAQSKSPVKSDRAQSKGTVNSDRANSHASIPVAKCVSPDTTKTSKKRNRNAAFGEK